MAKRDKNRVEIRRKGAVIVKLVPGATVTIACWDKRCGLLKLIAG